ncbi:MAG: PilN domain-containing protein [Desulfohalobiaceae bacterium]|nr:PilN domain-containing protein [Spirochaetales bacterium]MCF8038781.1 PilN domain-containing protein [Desulfohalobiaceae bacterium]
MALKDINLIPEDILARRKILRSIRLWSKVLAGLVLVISLYCGIQIKAIQEIKPDENRVAQTRNELLSLVDRIESSQKEYNRLLQERDKLLVPFDRTSASVPLQIIADNLNARTWLRQVEILSDPGQDNRDWSGRIDIRGEALSHADITGFLQVLQGNALFRDMELKYAQKEDSGRTMNGRLLPLIRFQIQGRLGSSG